MRRALVIIGILFWLIGMCVFVAAIRTIPDHGAIPTFPGAIRGTPVYLTPTASIPTAVPILSPVATWSGWRTYYYGPLEPDRVMRTALAGTEGPP